MIPFRTSDRVWTCAVFVVLIGSVVASCSTNDLSIEAFSASMDRQVFAGLTEEGVVVIDSSGTRRHMSATEEVKKALDDVDEVFLLGHETLVLFGEKYTGPAFDLFGHSGASTDVEVAMAVNLEDTSFASAHEMLPGLKELSVGSLEDLHLRQAPSSNNLYAWRGDETNRITVVNSQSGARTELDLPWRQARVLDLHESEGALHVAGGTEYPSRTGDDLILARFDADVWPPKRLERSRLDLPTYAELIDVQFSADGNRVAWSTREHLGEGRGKSFLGLVDFADAQPIFTYEKSSEGSFYSVEPLSGRDGVVYIETLSTDRLYEDRAGLVGPDGTEVKTWALDGAWGDVSTSPTRCGFWHYKYQATFISFDDETICATTEE